MIDSAIQSGEIPLHVEVRSESIKTDSQSADFFILSVGHTRGESWVIQRSRVECEAFITVMNPALAVEAANLSSATLKTHIDLILTNFGSQALQNSTLLKFFDSAPSQSPLTAVRLQMMEEKIHEFVKAVHSYDSRLSLMEEKNLRLNMLLTTLVEKKSAPLTLDSAQLARTADKQVITSKPTPSSNELAQSSTAKIPSAEIEGSISDISVQSSGSDEGKIAGHPAASQLPYLMQDNQVAPEAAWNSSEKVVEVTPSQRILDTLAYLADWSVEADRACDNILTLVQPHDSQVVYRNSVMSFLKKQVKIALNAMSFDAGLSELRCFLPGDPIRLCVIATQGQLSYWHNSLFERLKILVEAGAENRYDPEAGGNTIKHIVRSCSQGSDGSGIKVIGSIDSLEIEISANSRWEICFNAFVEDVDLKVGKEHLFKRSLLLLRAWWYYETAVYISSQVKHYLTDQILEIMLIAIFNVYCKYITSPLQALMFFLAEFANFDPGNSVITIQGIVPFANMQYPICEPVQNYHLIGPELMEKYWHLFNVETQAVGETRVAARPTSPASRQRQLLGSMSRALHKFERSSLNVLHPFTHMNAAQEKVPRVDILMKVFQTGLANLTYTMKQSLLNSLQTNYAVNNYFPTILSRFTGVYRPDAVNQTLAFSSEEPIIDILKGDYEAIWEGVHYANFIIETVLTESAILTFCSDLLLNKGPLPAGEVGKLLSETTAISQLSHRLREKFGGLKKFLEKYPKIFVFSNDHPFNPLVVLRKTLSAENLELIDRGIFPVHLLAKYSRAGNNKKSSKMSVSSDASPPSAGSSLPTSPFMREHSHIPPVSVEKAYAALGNSYSQGLPPSGNSYPPPNTVSYVPPNNSYPNSNYPQAPSHSFMGGSSPGQQYSSRPTPGSAGSHPYYSNASSAVPFYPPYSNSSAIAPWGPTPHEDSVGYPMQRPPPPSYNPPRSAHVAYDAMLSSRSNNSLYGMPSRTSYHDKSNSSAPNFSSSLPPSYPPHNFNPAYAQNPIREEGGMSVLASLRNGDSAAGMDKRSQIRESAIALSAIESAGQSGWTLKSEFYPADPSTKLRDANTASSGLNVTQPENNSLHLSSQFSNEESYNGFKHSHFSSF